MARLMVSFEKVRVMQERAEEIRTIADGLSQDDCRSFLHAIATDLERQAKETAYRVERKLKREFNGNLHS